MVRHPPERSLVLLRRTIRSLKICEHSLNELEEVIAASADRAAPAGRIGNVLGSQLRDPSSLYHTPLVDTAAMTVTWSGRTCHISSTILLGILDRLARRPNHYVTFDRLLRDVWNATRSDFTIRSHVRHLKSRLVAAGMQKLARMANHSLL